MKNLEKGIDKRKRKWYNNKAVDENVKFKPSGRKNRKKIYKTP